MRRAHITPGGHRLPHPFFESVRYPWRRRDAKELRIQLQTAIPNVAEIVAIYERSGGDRAALNPNAAPDEVWQNALNLLAAGGLIRDLIDELASIGRLKGNAGFQAAISAVREARPEGGQHPNHAPTPLDSVHRTAVGLVAHRLTSDALKIFEAEDIDPVTTDYIKACAGALESTVTSMKVDASEEVMSLLAKLLIATVQRPEVFDALLINPGRGAVLHDDDLGSLVFRHSVGTAEDASRLPLDIADLIEEFVASLPGFLRLVASRPGSPLREHLYELTPTEPGGAQRGQLTVQEADRLALRRTESRSAAGHLHDLAFDSGETVENAFAVDGSSYRSLRALHVSFSTVASFDRIVVVGPTSFIECTFEGGASFAESQFLGPVSFRGTRFIDPVDFSGSHFCSTVSFEDAVFERGVVFNHSGPATSTTIFESLVVATGSAYGAHADYAEVRFGGPFDAERTLGTSSASFRGAVFGRGGSLASGEYVAGVDLRRISVEDGALDLSFLTADHIQADYHERQTWDRVAGLDSIVQHGRLLRPPLPSPPIDEEPDKPTAGWASLAYVEPWDDGMLGLGTGRGTRWS